MFEKRSKAFWQNPLRNMSICSLSLSSQQGWKPCLRWKTFRLFYFLHIGWSKSSLNHAPNSFLFAKALYTTLLIHHNRDNNFINKPPYPAPLQRDKSGTTFLFTTTVTNNFLLTNLFDLCCSQILGSFLDTWNYFMEQRHVFLGHPILHISDNISLCFKGMIFLTMLTFGIFCLLLNGEIGVMHVYM